MWYLQVVYSSMYIPQKRPLKQEGFLRKQEGLLRKQEGLLKRQEGLLRKQEELLRKQEGLCTLKIVLERSLSVNMRILYPIHDSAITCTLHISPCLPQGAMCFSLFVNQPHSCVTHFVEQGLPSALWDSRA